MSRTVARIFIYVALALAGACHARRVEHDAGGEVPNVPAPSAATTGTTHDGPFTIRFVEFRNRDGALRSQRVVFRVTNASSLTPAWYEARFSFFDAAGAVVPVDASLGCVDNCAGDSACANGCRKSPWLESNQNVTMVGELVAIRPGETREFDVRTSGGPVPARAVYAEMHFVRACELVSGKTGAMRRGAPVWEAHP